MSAPPPLQAAPPASHASQSAVRAMRGETAEATPTASTIPRHWERGHPGRIVL